MERLGADLALDRAEQRDGLKPYWASTSDARTREPTMSRTALMIWIQVVATIPPATM